MQQRLSPALFGTSSYGGTVTWQLDMQGTSEQGVVPEPMDEDTAPADPGQNVTGKAYEVDNIYDCKLETANGSRANPTRLLFHVKWAPPYEDQDTWEPLANVSKLDALKDFLRSPRWQEFSASEAYKAYTGTKPSRPLLAQQQRQQPPTPQQQVTATTKPSRSPLA